MWRWGWANRRRRWAFRRRAIRRWANRRWANRRWAIRQWAKRHAPADDTLLDLRRFANNVSNISWLGESPSSYSSTIWKSDFFDEVLEAAFHR